MFFCFFVFPVYAENTKEKTNKLLPLIANLPIPHTLFNRFKSAYRHSNIRANRNSSDCKPDCPKVDVWKYVYKPNGYNKAITAGRPISTQKKFWKSKNEARVIAFSLFGNKKIYLDGLLEFIESIKKIQEVNNIQEDNFGYGSFTIRVYVAKRNPENGELGEIQGATDQVFINQLIDQGVEIAYVDNDKKRVGLDATFWRFMIAAEEMPKNQRIRYLVRDVDWLLTALDVFALGDWLSSNLSFHRMNIAPMCISPLTAGLWGGVHVGSPLIKDLKNKMEYFPYRLEYGDDEVFLRDFVWEKMKSSGSILTHVIKKRNILNKIIEPYKNSCEEPTYDFCAFYDKKNSCVDRYIPKSIHFPIFDLSNRKSIKEIKNKSFSLDESDHQVKEAIDALRVNN
jgi:hypothetical protein